MTLMLVGIGFLSVLTATISSRFVKEERSEETNPSPPRLHESEELAAVKAQLHSK